MNELMLHVERIVRPVIATEARKLRVRQELLAHLQSAVEQERKDGLDKHAAVQNAAQRLGNPAELTRQIQRTVPWFERIMLASLPVPRTFARWETEGARQLYCVGPIAMGHMSILCAVAGLVSGVPSYAVASVRNSLNHSGIGPVHPGMFFLSLLVVWQAIFFSSCRFVIAEANPRRRSSLPTKLLRIGIMILLQITFTVVTTATGQGRLPTISDVAGNIAMTCLLSIGAMFVARSIAARREPYEEWLTLSLAEDSGTSANPTSKSIS